VRAEEEHAEEEYRQVARRFVRMSDDFLKQLSAAGIPELELLPHPSTPKQAFGSGLGFHSRS
jgi:hypothetical protein